MTTHVEAQMNIYRQGIAETFGYKIGWKQHSGTMESRPWWIGKWGKEPLPKFSSSIDTALALVAEKMPGVRWRMGWASDNEFYCILHDNGDNIGGRASTTPLAILMALVAAMERKS